LGNLLILEDLSTLGGLLTLGDLSKFFIYYNVHISGYKRQNHPLARCS
jgi:hypothetical protein